MSTKKIAVLVLVVTASATSPIYGQARGRADQPTIVVADARKIASDSQPPIERPDVTVPMVEVVLRHKGRLWLSEEQVARIEEIARQLEEKNAPVKTKMNEARARLREELRSRGHLMTSEERNMRLEELRETLATGVRVIATNDKAARDGLAMVLTKEQLAEAERIMDQIRAKRELLRKAGAEKAQAMRKNSSGKQASGHSASVRRS